MGSFSKASEKAPMHHLTEYFDKEYLSVFGAENGTQGLAQAKHLLY